MDRMWRLIHSDHFSEDTLVSSLRDRFLDARNRARALCRVDEIPYYEMNGAISYFTFGGVLVNEALALFTGQSDYKIGDHWLTVNSPIEWERLPTAPQDYETVFERMFRPSSQQSIFQKMLPRDLQVSEYIQEWLNDESIPRVLSRLAAAAPVLVAPTEWTFG